MSPLLDPFIRGVTVGASLAIVFAVWRSGVSRHARVATVLAMASIAAWTMTESNEMKSAFGNALPLDVLAMVVGGSFWLWVAAVFEDRPISGWTLTPIAVLLTTGLAMNLAPKPISEVVWVIHNLIGVVLCLHAGFIVVRGWRGDLIESRRRLRGLIFGVAALFGVAEVAVVMAGRLEHSFSLHAFSVGGVYGGLGLAILVLASAALLLQGRPSLYGPSRRPDAGPDGRAEAADRQLLAKLDAFMAEGGWKAEGLDDRGRRSGAANARASPAPADQPTTRPPQLRGFRERPSHRGRQAPPGRSR